ncbi:MAG: spore coat protein [Clostridiaceae bacterium]|jgi:spore coat protein CotF|nr:spore coat protein [Clostridiaceae bacterium]
MAITFTQKEMLLLEDQKTHEQVCINKYTNYAAQAQDSQLKQIFDANGQVEREHLSTINQLISGHIPQLNQDQSQQQSQSMGQSSNHAYASGMSSAKAGMTGASDRDMCIDMLTTEKYVSGSYDAAIFEFNNTNVRDVLNHIQKEEQKHGEAISQYMQAKGLYNIQQ